MGLPLRKLEKRYTYADYKNWPMDERWELIDGVAWDMSPAPSRFHQHLGMELGSEIRDFLKGKPCRCYAAPFDVFFPEKPVQNEDEVSTVVQPDLSVICDPSKLIEKGCFGAPDLVVEILSPYTSKKDLNEKFRLYEASGVVEYWVIDPGSRSIHRFNIGKDKLYSEGDLLVEKGILTSRVLDGFSLDIEELFGSYK